MSKPNAGRCLSRRLRTRCRVREGHAGEGTMGDQKTGVGFSGKVMSKSEPQNE